MTRTVTVAMLAYGPEPYITDAVGAVLASTGVKVNVVVVDNGCSNVGLSTLGELDRVTLLRPGFNSGFSGGCNLALLDATSDVIALVNSDALVSPRALANLTDALSNARVGIATASIRLADQPERINSAGNPVTYTGLSWAGGLGDPVTSHALPREVASASGACLAMRRANWELLDGFDDAFLAYHEDTDLSLRCWQSGFSVLYVPAAEVLHHYEFSRNSTKAYLLERNRLLTLLVDYQLRTLFVISPALLLVEFGICVSATLGGWGPEKLRGYGWLLSHRKHIRDRRAWVQSRRRVADRDLAHLFSSAIEPGVVGDGQAVAPPGTNLVNLLLRAYWIFARRLI